MDYKNISEKIIGLKNADLKLRNKLVKSGKLGNGYNEEMERLHNENAEILGHIIDKIGYPTIDKVGNEANEATWFIIQHSIGKPDFMKKSMQLLKKSVKEKKSNPKNLAYLTDRIAVFEGKPQLYGTQFDWDENGELSPNRFDILENVNQRRKEIGLNSLIEQIQEIRKSALNENQTPLTNFRERQKEYNKWRKKVGWIK